MRLGVMQGRLTPPTSGPWQFFPYDWRAEFEKARELGLNEIEIVYCGHPDKTHPLFRNSGLEIRKFADDAGIKVSHILADFFLENPSVALRNTPWFDRLADSAVVLGAKSIELPIIEATSIWEHQENRMHEGCRKATFDFISKCLELAGSRGLAIGLEMDLKPDIALEFISSFNNERLWYALDIGNSAGAGFSIKDEMTLFEKIKNIHLKDRPRGGFSVPFGQGSVNFTELFDFLGKNAYSGSLTLQPVRMDGKDDFWWIHEQLSFVRRLLNGSRTHS